MMTLEPSQPTFFDGMELPLMSSRAASRAKTLALPEGSAEWAKAPGLASGLKSSVWLANYDRNTSSWRTSQRCLLAQANGEADGLAEFLETWPSAGMMLAGRSFQLPAWEPGTAAIGSGSSPIPTPRKIDGRSAGPGTSDGCLLRRSASSFGLNLAEFVQVDARKLFPTPQSSDSRDRGHLGNPAIRRRAAMGKQLNLSMVVSETSGALNPTWVEWLMGFPTGYTDLQS